MIPLLAAILALSQLPSGGPPTPHGLVRLYDSDGTRAGAFSDLRSALEVADDGAVLVLEPGLYIGEGNRGLLVEADVQILGRVGSARTVIDCRGLDRAFDLVEADVLPQGVTIRRGFAAQGGAIRASGGGLRMRDVVLEENRAEEGGGVFSCLADLRMSQCRMARNEATLVGGALELRSVGWIADCVFDGNVSHRGGAISVGRNLFLEPDTTVQLLQCLFVGNSATFAGGLHVFSSVAVVDRCRFVDNHAELNAGAVGAGGFGRLVLRDSLVATNTAGGQAAGVRAGGYSEIRGCTIVGNSSSGPGGGGVQAATSSAMTLIIGSIIRGNSSSESEPLLQELSSIPSPLGGPAAWPTLWCNLEGAVDLVTNIDADPLFVDAGVGDYRLQAGSPCIDAGPSDVTTPWDIDGDPRLLGRAMDIGMDELPVPGAFARPVAEGR